MSKIGPEGLALRVCGLGLEAGRRAAGREALRAFDAEAREPLPLTLDQVGPEGFADFLADVDEAMGSNLGAA
jgi:hypothetical protein